ncbi:MAG: hypothetical protein GVY10_10360 [Verrucomicrobia bacterium]|jgi:hypothetical protein|nr:hypothetical protein [Verrucomicrobiota bacterium]
MKTISDLFLHEELMLLALRDHKGTLATDNVEYVIAGAVLSELLLSGKIAVREQKKKLIEVLETTPTGDAVVDEALTEIHEARRPATIQDWVSRLAEIRNLKDKVARGLCEKGILRADEDKVLFLFTRKVYPEIDPGPEEAVIDRLYKAVFEREGDEPPRTVILLSLARQADLLKITFGKDKVKSKEDRIERLTRGELAGAATGEAIEAIQAALVAATVVPVIVTN